MRQCGAQPRSCGTLVLLLRLVVVALAPQAWAARGLMSLADPQPSPQQPVTADSPSWSEIGTGVGPGRLLLQGVCEAGVAGEGGAPVCLLLHRLVLGAGPGGLLLQGGRGRGAGQGSCEAAIGVCADPLPAHWYAPLDKTTIGRRHHVRHRRLSCTPSKGKEVYTHALYARRLRRPENTHYRYHRK